MPKIVLGTTAPPPVKSDLDILFDDIFIDRKDLALKQQMADKIHAKKALAMQAAAQYQQDTSLMSGQGYAGGVGILGGLGGASAAQNAGNPTSPPRYSPMEKLMARLDVRHGSQLPFDYIYAHVCAAKDHVIVFLIKDGEPITLLDEIPLFPSDSLIGKLNLLRG